MESGVNVNLQDDEGRIPLFNSLRNKAQENFHILLPHTDVSLKTNDGQTGLQIVLRSSRVWPVEGFCEEAVPMLIEKGVDVNALTDDKVSALSDACTLGNLQIFEALIKAGCDVNAPGFGGLTVLDQVSRTITSDPSEPKTEETVLTMGKMLIDAGATVEGEYDTETSPILAAILTGKHLLVREFMLTNFRIKVVRRGPGPIIQPFRELLCNFLRACFQSNIMDIASYIYVDCCCCPDGQELWTIFFEYFATKKELLAEQGIHPSPVSLSRLCRVALRAALPRGRTFQGAVDQLPLAPHVRRFVGLRS